MSEKVSIEELKNMAANEFLSVTDAEWKGIQLHIKRCLSIEDMMLFVNSVVSSCFAAETSEYLPEIKDFAIRCAILTYYTGLTLPESLSERYEIAYTSGLTSSITNYVDTEQYDAMLDAIERKISYQAHSNIEAINQQMNEIINNFNDLEDKLVDVFSGIDSNTISNIASAIANGNFDEQKLVKAFTNETSAGEKVVPMPKRTE